jgi:hypothetical protein
MANYDLLLTPTLAVPPFAIHMQGPEKIDGRYVQPAEFLCFTFPILPDNPPHRCLLDLLRTACRWGYK